MRIKLIEGENHTDDRGIIQFANDFNMGEIVRFYAIAPASTKIIRAWQAHRYEKKWFFCSSGSFVINVVEIDDFGSPSPEQKPLRFELDHKKPAILAISGGNATGIRASEPDSKLLVYSNFTLNESQSDDYRFPTDQWSANW